MQTWGKLEDFKLGGFCHFQDMTRVKDTILNDVNKVQVCPAILYRPWIIGKGTGVVVSI